jgi:polysaccharide pyruvyl transferase WcaK-like protein
LKPKICVLGPFGQGNLGNECTLQALLHHVRRYFPSGELLCICSEPSDTSTRHNIPSVLMSRRNIRNGAPNAARPTGSRMVRWLRRARTAIPREMADWLMAFKTLKGRDMLIVSGSFLTDFSGSLLDWPYDIFKWSVIAKLCRCRLLFVSVGAGPIYEPVNRWFVRSALSLADFRSYRETSTVAYLKSLGFATDGDPVYPDLAFSLPLALVRSPVRGARRPVVGIGLMNDPAKLRTDTPSRAMHPAYLEKLASFSRWLLAQGYDLRLLIGDFVYDRAVVREFDDLLRNPSNDGRISSAPASSVEELLSQLMETDFVVATRFHNVLLALALNKPVIAVTFHHKSVSLMNAMGLSEYAQDIGDLDVGRLIERFGELERDATELKALIRQTTGDYRRLLDEQYELLFGDVGAQRDALVGSTPRPAVH